MVFATFASLLLQSTAFAAVGDQGVDWSRYQGANGIFGYAHDKFAICQIGGINRDRKSVV